MRPLFDDRVWRPVEVGERGPARELEVIQLRGRQTQLAGFSTLALEAMNRPVFPGRPRTRESTAQVDADRERTRNRHQLHRQWFWRLKKNVGCAVCGERSPTSLEFHHVNAAEKSFPINVGNLARARDDLYAEMQKCVLVCSRCHRAIHHEGLDVTSFERFDPWIYEARP